MWNLWEPASTISELFLQVLNVLNWILQCQDVINSKPGFAWTEGN